MAVTMIHLLTCVTYFCLTGQKGFLKSWLEGPKNSLLNFFNSRLNLNLANGLLVSFPDLLDPAFEILLPIPFLFSFFRLSGKIVVRFPSSGNFVEFLHEPVDELP